MFGIEILEVVIGLIFVYLLFSLFVTIVNEIITSVLQSRGKELQFVILQMLGRKLLKEFYTHKRISRATLRSSSFFNKKIFDPYGTKEGLNMPHKEKRVLPSEIPSNTFSEILVSILKRQLIESEEEIRKRIAPEKDIRFTVPELLFELSKPYRFLQIQDIECTILKNEYIRELLLNGLSNLDDLKIEIEKWYEEMMGYATDWYKRKLRYFLLGLGFITAAIFNVNTFAVVQKLADDPDARQKIASQTEGFVNQYQNTNGKLVFISDSDSVLSVDNNFLAIKQAIQAAKKKLAEATTDDSLRITNNIKRRYPLINDTSLSQIDLDSLVALIDSVYQDTIPKIVDLKLREEYPSLLKVDSLNSTINRLYQEDIKQASSILGLGWSSVPDFSFNRPIISYYLEMILGWILTSIAISLGAPFWFDLLNKVIKIKNELKPKEEK